ncbi:DUF192 domain-containing protein [Phenylobacterium soli]|uniref:DUF192 domain-containing protein n=1 Tax=Phenylobacterium soli TaxID=2170551 RepID=A0A328AJY8_9CAUL|nr:DUF192 domain-containing protein [Phenylobacterium soli]RAK55273.1 DUF192 domain-containing protein [Phenylobacterium soli]
MPHRSVTGRRPWLALGLVLALTAPAATAAHAEIGRQGPGRCVGQPVLKPLQPLVIRTARGPARFLVEMADTPRKREFGLMCRKHLAADRGMLFDFQVPSDDVAFWMRNTLIGLDIVYIRPDGTILSIARDARPLDETPIAAGGTIRAVLELRAGRAAELGLRPGDRIEHRIFPR